jgi:putative endonuclease
MKCYYVYITTNPARTVLYIGVTNNLARRMSEHRANRNHKLKFAGKYFCYNLIYYEEFYDIRKAISREKEIKKWRREKKENLINTMNPEWNNIIVYY